MPALPWTQRRAVDPGRPYLAMASRLPLRRQLARAHGMVGYALDAELARKTFWTFSVWEDQASLDAFAASDPHRAITRRLQPLMGRTRFEFFPIPGSDLPMTWDQMKAPVRGRRSPAGTQSGTAAGGGADGYGRRGERRKRQ